jgi:hypothetical protein
MSYFMAELWLPQPLNDEFYALIPRHRKMVNDLIERGIVNSYTVDENRTKIWILFSASEESEVLAHLKNLPIFRFVKVEIFKLFIADGDIFRLPKVNLN